MKKDDNKKSRMGQAMGCLLYTSVIPIILAIWIASYVERFFEKYLPLVVRNLFTPMFTIAVMVPLTLLCLLYTSCRIWKCSLRPLRKKTAKEGLIWGV